MKIPVFFHIAIYIAGLKKSQGKFCLSCLSGWTRMRTQMQSGIRSTDFISEISVALERVEINRLRNITLLT